MDSPQYVVQLGNRVKIALGDACMLALIYTSKQRARDAFVRASHHCGHGALFLFLGDLMQLRSRLVTVKTDIILDDSGAVIVYETVPSGNDAMRAELYRYMENKAGANAYVKECATQSDAQRFNEMLSVLVNGISLLSNQHS